MARISARQGSSTRPFTSGTPQWSSTNCTVGQAFARLAAIGGGGTNVSAPLALLNKQHAPVDLVVIVSDNESWVDARRHGGTETMRQWAGIKARCPQARLVCIDIQPNGTTQAAERADVMNVGGFSDAVFSAVAQFAGGTLDANHWVGEIEKIALDAQ